MQNILASLFCIGCIDLFNPAGVSIVMLLIPLVKRHWHILLFIIGSYIAYLSAGIAVFFGFDRYLKTLYFSFCGNMPLAASAIKLGIGIACVVGFIFMVLYLIKAAVNHRELSMGDMLTIRSVSPIFIVLLSFGSTWSQIFSCFPLFAFIGVLSSNHVTVSEAAVYLSVFCLFIILPLIAVYVLYYAVSGERLQKIMNTIRKIMTAFCFYCIPVLFAIGACWGIAEGIKIFDFI